MTFPITPILSIAERVLDNVLPNTAERDRFLAEMQVELAKQLSEVNKAQTEVNKTEATHSRLFVAGWRPFIGWVCGVALAWHFIGFPIGVWFAAVYDPSLTLPTINPDGLFELVLGMLGLGGLRTYEKKVGVTR